MDERIIDSFIKRGIYANQREVISAALRALVKEQKSRESSQRTALYSDSTYLLQAAEPGLGNIHAPVGPLGRKSKVR
ncbi:MAG: hypothetical protein ACXWP5_16600 [Bdellovibrionota bacterium]